MKIRKGFVGNSSSTSFCIAGKYFEKDSLELLFPNTDEDEYRDKLYEIFGKEKIYEPGRLYFHAVYCITHVVRLYLVFQLSF